jgi:ABC-2 type transport system permease protein
MKAIRELITRLLRGPGPSRCLAGLGIDARRFWLLMDLFDTLSDRGEMLDQLGRNGVALRVMVLLYAVFAGLLGLALALSRPAPGAYLLWFLAVTAFFLLTTLLSETGNSLVNPEEGLVLAHQPVNGATYTAAKLGHLARIVLWMTSGLNIIPAFLGLLIKKTPWFYPLFHLVAALGAGLIAALLCCALYGWLMRFLPARRLKAAGQLAGMLPFLGFVLWGRARRWLAGADVLGWIPSQEPFRWALGLTAAVAAIAIVVFGIRSLSADYLIRVSSIVRGGSAGGAAGRRSRVGAAVARFCGGQPARAGFEFVLRMARRDFQFRRQAIPIAFMLLSMVVPVHPTAIHGWRTDPFSGRFTTVHVLPHLIGFTLFMVCSVLAYGNDFKGAWIFQLAPARAFGRFARGIHAALCIPLVVVPHAILLPFLVWFWGLWHAGLFVLYSAAVSSTYLALELRLIQGLPFSSQVDAKRGATQMPIMILGAIIVAVAVALQYFIIFRSYLTVMAAVLVVGVTAYFLTRWSIEALAASIRYRLGLLSAEAGNLYREVEG